MPLQKGIKRNRDALLCKRFSLWTLHKICIKASLSPILEIVLQYGDAVEPLLLINYQDCKKELLEFSQMVGMIHLQYHLSKDLVSLPLKSQFKLKQLRWLSSL